MTFLEMLTMIRDGALVAQLTDETKDVIASVVENGKKGSITLKITFEPNGESALTIIPEVTAKQAKAGVGKAVLFADGGGELHRRDPRQGDVEDYLRRTSSTAPKIDSANPMEKN